MAFSKLRSRGAFAAAGLACVLVAGGAATPVWAAASVTQGQDLTSRYIAANWAVKNYKAPVLVGASECTFFVSLALWEAGVPPTREWNWDTKEPALRGGNRTIQTLTGAKHPTIAATSADDFKNYMVNSGRGKIKEVAWSDNTAGGAQLGDVIAYDWEGRPDGKIDHLAIVTSFTPEGYPRVTQRTVARKDRFWSWDPSANNWIEKSKAVGGDKPRVYLIHIKY